MLFWQVFRNYEIFHWHVGILNLDNNHENDDFYDNDDDNGDDDGGGDHGDFYDHDVCDRNP